MIKSLKNSFNFYVMLPIALLIGFCVGFYADVNSIPPDLLKNAGIMLVGVWFGLALLTGLIDVVGMAVSGLADGGDTDKLVTYVVLDGQVIDQLKSVRGYVNGVEQLPLFRKRKQSASQAPDNPDDGQGAHTHNGDEQCQPHIAQNERG